VGVSRRELIITVAPKSQQPNRTEHLGDLLVFFRQLPHHLKQPVDVLPHRLGGVAAVPDHKTDQSENTGDDDIHEVGREQREFPPKSGSLVQTSLSSSTARDPRLAAGVPSRAIASPCNPQPHATRLVTLPTAYEPPWQYYWQIQRPAARFPRCSP